MVYTPRKRSSQHLDEMEAMRTGDSEVMNTIPVFGLTKTKYRRSLNIRTRCFGALMESLRCLDHKVIATGCSGTVNVKHD
ncbi:Hypothetical protein PHPALM_18038 [Phytophthora palmivora]|uniref:Uncharacterized protein n=1 Tax=Phytophthora palmivora TaxID=4796 RepID=A0A2P4XKS6_9STRA|nr:Hypothetical protein PHPALM_18038 [Phytophthora palmivora]